LAKQQDKTALADLYQGLVKAEPEPDAAHQLLLGKIAEFLKRHQEAVAWYEAVPQGPHHSEARLRAINARHELGDRQGALAQVRALQADASVEDDVRRDAYLLEAELHQRSNQP